MATTVDILELLLGHTMSYSLMIGVSVSTLQTIPLFHHKFYYIKKIAQLLYEKAENK